MSLFFKELVLSVADVCIYVVACAILNSHNISLQINLADSIPVKGNIYMFRDITNKDVLAVIYLR
jgi:hypothetical protein